MKAEDKIDKIYILRSKIHLARRLSILEALEEDQESIERQREELYKVPDEIVSVLWDSINFYEEYANKLYLLHAEVNRFLYLLKRARDIEHERNKEE